MSQEYVLDLKIVFGGEDQILGNVALRVDDSGGGAFFVGDEVGSMREAIQIELFEDHGVASDALV
jgi:hypothetical protein